MVLFCVNVNRIASLSTIVIHLYTKDNPMSNLDVSQRRFISEAQISVTAKDSVPICTVNLTTVSLYIVLSKCCSITLSCYFADVDSPMYRNRVTVLGALFL